MAAHLVTLQRRLVPGRRVRRALLVVSAVLAVVAVVGLAAHWVTMSSAVTLALAAGAPYLMLGAPLAAVALAFARTWLRFAAAVALTVLCLATQMSLYVPTDPPGDAVGLRVMTSNLRLGNGDPQSLVDAVGRHRVDVLMLEELTVPEQRRLEAAGLDRLLPFHASAPDYGARGTGLWSRYPLTDVRMPTGFTFHLVVATVRVPRLSRPTTVVALHLAGPVPDTTDWRHDIARLPQVLRQLPGSAPVVVGGDFNATPDTTQFRRLLSGGYADAADEAGAGTIATFPADQWYPPLIAIDHVLTRGGAVATDVATVTVADSDHRALLVRVAVPRAS